MKHAHTHTYTHTTEAPQHTVDNRVVCASLSAAEKKKRRTCNVSSFHYKLSCLMRIPTQTRLLAAAAARFPPVWWPDEFGCDLYCLPREHNEQIALSLATVYLVLSYLYQFP